ncbi:MAG: AI-2E family transporter, partial [Eubacterium sp.]
ALFFMVVFLYILIPSIVESVINLAGHIPQYTREINRFLDQLSQSGTALKDLAGIIRVELANFTDLTLKGFFDRFVGDPGSASGSMAQMGNLAMLFAKGTTSFLISSVAVFFSGFYLMLDKENIQGQCQRLFRALMSDSVYGGFTWVVHTIDDVFYRYFAGKIMTSALIGLICYVGLLILGVEYAPLIALVVGVTNVIPYFGPIIGAIPGILLTLLYSPMKALWVAIWILIVQQFDGNILGPTVLGRIVELNPFWVLLSVMVGGSLMGPFGMFIAIPFFAVIKIFLVEGLNRWEAHR